MNESWVTGDHLGLPFPADAAALRGGGPGFLTDAFRAFGALGPADAVTRIVRSVEVGGGSTGRKLSLDVEYAATAPPPTELFVKFSRDFDDPARDHGRDQMAAEVTFATLARAPGFPIAVPTPLFADFHRPSGTGILISERIPFGRGDIEPQYHKCLDDEMPTPAEHYRAVITALARLAGAHRAGVLPAHLIRRLPLDLRAATVGEPPPLDADRLDRRLARLAEFAAAHPRLLPGDADFFARLRTEAQDVLAREGDIWRSLADDHDYLALCHWNANVDNAWFWRDAAATLHCGLMDWGCVSQMNVAMALWGALSAAETTLWDKHFDELTELFCVEVRSAGGPRLEAATLRAHTLRYLALMGVTWLLTVPALLSARVPGLGPHTTRHDETIRGEEALRAPTQMLTNVLNVWRTRDVAGALAELS